MGRYILKTKKDFEILDLCRKLVELKLSKNDRDLVELIKTQLEKDWRAPLLKELNKILKNYKNRH